tara:strand:+ start:313 stop:1278 length:966 start_codon:yes stop_codon:yes gene_type:complete
MIYFILLAVVIIYLLILSRGNNDSKNVISMPSKLIILSLSALIIYIFSLSYDFSNALDYKKIHTKNLTVRENIKTIKENIPKLEARLLNSSDDFNGWLMLGKSYSILKNYNSASKAYEVAINLRPDNMDALREYILVLRSDSEVLNKDLIKKYFKIFINQTNEPQALLDLLSFSFNINDNLLAQETLVEIINHPKINNKNEYKKILTNLQDNSVNTNTILDLSVSSKDSFEGYFFMILKEKNINQPFAIKRIKANRGNISVKFTSDDFMLGQDIEVPNEFELVIKHSSVDRFSSDSKLVEVFKMNIDNYNDIRQEKLKITF